MGIKFSKALEKIKVSSPRSYRYVARKRALFKHAPASRFKNFKLKRSAFSRQLVSSSK